MTVESQLSVLPGRYRRLRPPLPTRREAMKRILDTLGCVYGAWNLKPVRLIREVESSAVSGPVSLWGTRRRLPGEAAAWANGAAVRALDFNDTYLSREPCHPSDLLASVWAAVELSGRTRQGRLLMDALILGYEVLGRLCDAASLRVRGWDHVTYLPIASAVACAHVFRLSADQTRHAVSLAATANQALRQTRVGRISDWKAACAAYAARAGLSAARLAARGFTGPDDVFSGRHGFETQVSGPLPVDFRRFGDRWMMLRSHIKRYPAEHHAQSAIEAALEIRSRAGGGAPTEVLIETFAVSAAIIGSEPEKWKPTTRETADHSLPYLVAAALLDGEITLDQYESRRFADHDIRRLMRATRVAELKRLSRAYPTFLPNRVAVRFRDGRRIAAEIRRPLGYAGRPMSAADVESKFLSLAAPRLGSPRARRLSSAISGLDRVDRLSALAPLMAVKR